jgi:hypothetical protein
MLTDSKTLLAKLMATENITVEQRKVSTASFDVNTRVLTLPVLDSNISPFLYDLFLGHEVGHALYTPLDGLLRAGKEKIPRTVSNVIEDSRIERKIKNKYPGIRSSFVRGYRELIEKDFFGTTGTDLNDLNFIDRVNLYTKGGVGQGIQFNEFEKNLVNKIENTETYEDVILVAREVVAYMKEEAETERKLNQAAEEFEPSNEEDEEDGGWDDAYDDADNEEDSDDEENQPNSAESDESSKHEADQKETDHESDDSEANEDSSKKDDEDDLDTKAFTDEAYRKNESRLFDIKSTGAYYYGNIPSVDTSKAVVNYKDLWNKYRVELEASGYAHHERTVDTKSFLKVRNDAKKVVGYLAKEFQLRKNAEQLQRSAVSKTGELNMNKIHSYKFAEDIFKTITIVPGAKSHGLVMFLDWSGSMQDHLQNTLKQLINLVMFCKKVNIPYEVYAFTDEYEDFYTQPFQENNIALRKFKILNLISSKMSAPEFSYACSVILGLPNFRSWKPDWLCMGGTPLNEAIISSMNIVPEFRKQYNLQVVNTVFLTDGAGHKLNTVYHILPDGHKTEGWPGVDRNTSRYDTKMVIRDPSTKHEVIVNPSDYNAVTQGYIKMLKLRTKSNIVGFYILSGRELRRQMGNFFPLTTVTSHDRYKVEFRKNKHLVITSAGFDEYYLLNSDGLDTDVVETFEVKGNATTRGLTSAFSKFAGGRLNNRVVLNRFIGMIS